MAHPSIWVQNVTSIVLPKKYRNSYRDQTRMCAVAMGWPALNSTGTIYSVSFLLTNDYTKGNHLTLCCSFYCVGGRRRMTSCYAYTAY